MREEVRFDEKLVLEHILQMSFDGKELKSLSGQTYQFVGDKKLKSGSVEVTIVSRDVVYAPNDSGRTYRRLFISNCLDRRYYKADYEETKQESTNIEV